MPIDLRTGKMIFNGQSGTPLGNQRAILEELREHNKIFTELLLCITHQNDILQEILENAKDTINS